MYNKQLALFILRSEQGQSLDAMYNELIFSHTLTSDEANQPDLYDTLLRLRSLPKRILEYLAEVDVTKTTSQNYVSITHD